jgi:AcrR family transcriptional regulator
MPSDSSAASHPYHHGDLRAALLRAAVDAIDESGPAELSVRAVARRVGVTHAAATYHFGDKAGLLTAIAAEGHRLLAEELEQTERVRGDFLEVGVAYVRFAVNHQAHFEVMFRRELYRPDDPELRAALAATARSLYGTSQVDRDQMAAGVAAWSLVHGIATLWLSGALPKRLGDDPQAITRMVATHLRPGRRGRR